MRHVLSLLTLRLRVWQTARFFRRVADALGKLRRTAVAKDAPEEVVQHIQEVETKFRTQQEDLEALYGALGEVIWAEMPLYLYFCIENRWLIVASVIVASLFALWAYEIDPLLAVLGTYIFLGVLAFLLAMKNLLDP